MRWTLGPPNHADPTTRLSSFKWLAMRRLGAEIASVASRARGVLLDVGCGERRFAPYLTPHVSRYVGLDYPATYGGDHRHVDVFGDGLHLPFVGASFDSVACFEVMEHVTDAKALVAEIARVVRPGGAVLLTVPFLWGEHCQPHDYARFTVFGVRRVFEDAGLSVELQRRVGGYWLVAGQRLCYRLANLYRGPLGVFSRPLTFLVLVCASLLETLDPEPTEYAMSLVVARRPPAESGA